MKKIEDLKKKIDLAMKIDPLVKVREKVKYKNLKFILRQTTPGAVRKMMRRTAKKKRKGKDGIPQDCLLLGEEVIVQSLTDVINASIKSGIFPTQ